MEQWIDYAETSLGDVYAVIDRLVLSNYLVSVGCDVCKVSVLFEDIEIDGERYSPVFHDDINSGRVNFTLICGARGNIRFTEDEISEIADSPVVKRAVRQSRQAAYEFLERTIHYKE
jgi:hypothetical protein